MKEYRMKKTRFGIGARGGAAGWRFKVFAAALVFAPAFAGCDFIRQTLGLSDEDPDPPASGAAEETVFVAAVEGLTAGDITLTALDGGNSGITPGTLTPGSTPFVYRLGVDGVTAEGSVEVAVTRNGSPAAEAPGSAIDLIKAAYEADSLSVSVQLQPGVETVSFGTDDLLQTGLTLNTGASPACVTIDGGGRTVDLTGSARGSLITVGQGVTLTLRNITFKGLRKTTYTLNGVACSAGTGDDTDNNAALIKVNGGTLIIEDGVQIQDNTASGEGGGVQVNSGTFIMKGGTISGNTGGYASPYRGGGVLVSGGTFKMEGGNISRNRTAGSGGGVGVQSGTFIKNDDADNDSGTIYGSNGGTDANIMNSDGGGGDNGYAVYVGSGKIRNTTAGPTDTLDSTKSDGGGWE
jgi:hypothetical protein